MLTSKLNGLLHFGSFFSSFLPIIHFPVAGVRVGSKQSFFPPDGIKHTWAYQCTNSLYLLLKIISYTESKTQVHGTLFNIFSDV